MGGWSIGFHREGFECHGLDIVDVGYPYELILCDVRDYVPPGGVYDVVVASPPCVEFSVLTRGLAAMGRHAPPDPMKGMELVNEAWRVICEVHPKFWVLENVQGSFKHIYQLLGQPNMKFAPYYLWGNFPKTLLSSSERFMKIHSMGLKTGSIMDAPGRFSPLASWIRAKIPYPLARMIAQACKERLLEDSVLVRTTRE